MRGRAKVVPHDVSHYGLWIAYTVATWRCFVSEKKIFQDPCLEQKIIMEDQTGASQPTSNTDHRHIGSHRDDHVRSIPRRSIFGDVVRVDFQLPTIIESKIEA